MFVNGETFSPTPYVIPLTTVAPLTSITQAPPASSGAGGPPLPVAAPQAPVPVPSSSPSGATGTPGPPPMTTVGGQPPTTAASVPSSSPSGATGTPGPPLMTNVGGQAPTTAASAPASTQSGAQGMSGPPSMTTASGGGTPNTLSPIPMSLGTVSVSSQTVSMGSVGTLSSVSIPSNSSPTAPTVFLTPTNTRPRVSRATSSSPMTRAHHHPIPRRASSVSPIQQQSPGSPGSPGDFRCPYCLLVLAGRYQLNRHVLTCQFRFDPSIHNIRDYCVLTRPPNYAQTSLILRQLTLADKIKMCRLNKWAIPNLWPLVFPRNLRPIPPIISEMTASKESTNILRGLLRTESEVSLPRKILLVDTEQHIQSVLPPRYLTPGTIFLTRTTADNIIVSPGIIIIPILYFKHLHLCILSVVQTPVNDDVDSDDDIQFQNIDEVTFNIRGQFQPGQYQSSSNPLDDTLPDVSQSPVDTSSDTLVGSNMGDVDPRYTLSAALRALLPNDWNPGIDGMGTLSSAHAKNTMFRRPWEFHPSLIRSLTRMSKEEFFQFVESSIGSRTKPGELNLFSESLMMLMKLAHDVPYDMLGGLFGLSPPGAQTVVYRQLMHQYLHQTNIPCILRPDGSVNQAEVEKLFQSAYDNTQDFYKTFNFVDPLSLGRIGVFLNIDASYLFTQNSSDIELQKSIFCLFKAGHVFKWFTITDLLGKVQGICPAATSNTPSSGDKSIIARYIQLEDNSPAGQYIRTIMKGTNRFFPIWVVDSGFVAHVPNAPRETRDLDGLVELCLRHGALIIHPSNVHDLYHLFINDRGLLEKVPRAEDRPTLDEATVKFTRLLRYKQEMSFGAEKRMFKIIGAKHIPNSLIEPLSPTFMKIFRVPECFADTPKITFIATVCMSLYNQIHAGYKLLFFDTTEHEIQAAENMMRRIQAGENPLLHNVFGIRFESRARGPWSQHSFGDFSGPTNPLNIPKITLNEVNPTAIQMVSGPHAINRAMSVLTYCSQIHVKQNQITGDEATNIIQSFPTFHKVESLRVDTRPDHWEDDLFGPFQPVTFVRSLMPPTHRSISSPQNFHMCVIAFGDVGNNRLGLIPPFDRVLYWYCYGCPSLNALCSMDRHLAALIMGLSFQDLFKSTAKNVRILNPVALETNQCLVSLPMMQQSREIPQQVGRRTRDRRQSDTNPLYVYGDSQRSTSLVSPRRARSTLQGRATTRGGSAGGGRTSRGSSLPGVPSTAPGSSSPSRTQAPASQPRPIQGVPSTAPGSSSASQSRPVSTGSANLSRRGNNEMLVFLLIQIVIIFFLVIPVSVDAHLRRIDQIGMYSIPPVSPLQPIDSNNFSQNHLQPGLLNDSNCCCLISIILCFHRLGFINVLNIPPQMNMNPGSPDLAAGVLAKILSSFPSSNAFSIHTFIETWNQSQLGLVLGQNEDLYIAEGILKHLTFQNLSGVPFLTKFTASYHCPQCQTNYRGFSPPSFEVIPELELPNQPNPVNPSDLLTDLINENLNVTCQVCLTNINNASYEVVKGKVTILRLNRLGLQGGRTFKIMTPLEFGPRNSLGSDLLGELVGVTCHISGHMQHWLSYTKAFNAWYQNDDRRRPVPSSPFNSNEPGETINLLCYIN